MNLGIAVGLGRRREHEARLALTDRIYDEPLNHRTGENPSKDRSTCPLGRSSSESGVNLSG
jgi:hypothetical protein